MSKSSKPTAARAKPVAQGQAGETTVTTPAQAVAQASPGADLPAPAVTAPTKPVTDDTKAAAYTHRIAAKPEQGFWRAGRKWHREGEDVKRDDFTDEQWAALEAEPLLIITTL